MDSYNFDLVKYGENGMPYVHDSIDVYGDTYIDAIANALKIIETYEDSDSIGLIVIPGEK